MKRLSPTSVVVALSLGSLATTTVAHANVEVGGTAGVHVFSKDNELGVQDVPNAPHQRTSGLFGLRVGVFFTDILGVEGEFGVVPSIETEIKYSITNLTYRAHLVAQFRAGDPSNKVIPFVFAGAGAFSVVSTANSKVEGQVTRDITEDTDAMFYAGAGIKYRAGANWGLRADARLMIVPSSENDSPPSKDTSKVTLDFEVLGSIYFDFGRSTTTTVEAPPPMDDDPDKDGIVGAADQCPTDPEDKDAYQDDDGCPEPDNDADGILDPNDKCPTDAEDKDGFEDEDGCPEADNDKDGIVDNADKCPMEPEDKDGFQDDDGCPDPDNDGDGVLDGADKCVDQPETRNGYQDEDGCPDEIPAKIKKFTGAIQGINFRVGSDALLATSNKVLDQAVAVLKEFPDLKIEIQGHTDDQLYKKASNSKFADNLELSQGRAESVRAYFVKKGIDESRIAAKGYGESQPVVDPNGLKGGKLKAARSKNRRVEFQLVGGVAGGMKK